MAGCSSTSTTHSLILAGERILTSRVDQGDQFSLRGRGGIRLALVSGEQGGFRGLGGILWAGLDSGIQTGVTTCRHPESMGRMWEGWVVLVDLGEGGWEDREDREDWEEAEEAGLVVWAEVWLAADGLTEVWVVEVSEEVGALAAVGECTCELALFYVPCINSSACFSTLYPESRKSDVRIRQCDKCSWQSRPPSIPDLVYLSSLTARIMHPRPPQIALMLPLEGSRHCAMPDHAIASRLHPLSPRPRYSHNAGVVPYDKVSRLLPLNGADVFPLTTVVEQGLNLLLALIEVLAFDMVRVIYDVQVLRDDSHHLLRSSEDLGGCGGRVRLFGGVLT